jgi:hypothetical protein
MNEITQSELDNIYDTINFLMINGKWKVLDQLFSYWEQSIWRTDVDILLGYATASFPGKSKIPSRQKFINTCKKFHSNVELWKGLE